MEMVNVDELRPHDRQEFIYGKEIDEAFAKDVASIGIRVPLLITRDKRIISGHSRWEVAKKAGVKEVPVTYFEGEDEDAILEELLRHNMGRKKSEWSLAAEAGLIWEIEEKR